MARVPMPMEIDEDWQSNKSVTQCNRHMWTNKLDCDVTFIVGTERESIGAHKYVLLSRSRVFYAMFAGPLSGNTGDEVEIPDIDPETFNTMMLFLYCEEIKLTLDNVMFVLYAAKKYCIQSLINKCLNKLKSNMVPSNVCTVMENAHMFDNVELREKCRNLIHREPSEVFRSDTFSDLCTECLESIINYDGLPLKETEIFEALLRYSEEKCTKNGVDITPENRLRYLGNTLKCVRFTQMDQEYFLEKVEPSGLLTPADCVKLLKYFMRPEGVILEFNTKPRKFRYTVQRFKEISSGWGFKRDKVDAITFKCSADVLIHGVQIYGSDQGASDYEVNMLLQQRPYLANLSQKKVRVETDGAQKIYELLFDKPVKIYKDKEYDFNLTFKGRTTFYGVNGETDVGDDIKFTFSASNTSTNNTSPARGQIPGIIYEPVPDEPIPVARN